MSATRKLTAAAIERFRRPPSGQKDHFDAAVPGFALRVSTGGTKSYVLFYRIGGRLRRLTLGRHPLLSLSEARERARDALREVEQGHDPRYGKAERKRQQADTFDRVAAEFIERYAKPKNRSWAEVQRVFGVYVSPTWGERPVQQISRRDVVELLDNVLDENGPYMANRVLAHVRKLFAWAMERDIVPANPATGVKAPGVEKSRDRVLSDEEIAKIWDASGSIGHPFGGLVRLLLVTGQRRDEVARMCWSNLDLESRLWTLPREQTKSDRAHDVPLSSLAMEVISQIPRTGEYVFSSGRRGDKPVSGYSVAKRRLERVSGVQDWRFHDLRRTAASGMAKLNVPPHVVEKCLNHANGTLAGVAGVYNRYGYLDEKAEALERWAQQVRKTVEPAA